MIYKDLRGFIKQVDELGALRRINGADQKYGLGGITEVAAGMPECPALLFDRIKGLPAGLPRLHQRHHDAATRRTGARHRSLLQPLDALKAWMQRRQTLKPQKPVEVKERRIHGEFRSPADTST